MNSRFLLSSVEAKEYYEYITRLAGGNLSNKDLLVYAGKLLEVVDVIEDWRTDKDSVEVFFKGGGKIIASYLWKEHSNFYNMIERLAEAVTEKYVGRIREIFNDPEGKYLLGWHDFCHTGRKELILVPRALRDCSRGLLCLISEREGTVR